MAPDPSEEFLQKSQKFAPIKNYTLSYQYN